MSKEKLDKTISSFAGKLKESPILKDFYEARERLDKDANAQEIILDLECFKSDLMEKQKSKKITEEDIIELNALNKKVEELEIYQEYLQIEKAVKALSLKVSEELSSQVGFDFGRFVAAANEGGCGCGC